MATASRVASHHAWRVGLLSRGPHLLGRLGLAVPAFKLRPLTDCIGSGGEEPCRTFMRWQAMHLGRSSEHRCFLCCGPFRSVAARRRGGRLAYCSAILALVNKISYLAPSTTSTPDPDRRALGSKQEIRCPPFPPPPGRLRLNAVPHHKVLAWSGRSPGLRCDLLLERRWLLSLPGS